MRAGICSLVDRGSGMEAVGTASVRDPDAIMTLVQKSRPDVALLFWGINEPGTVAGQVRRIRIGHPECRVIFVCELLSAYLVNQARHAGAAACMSADEEAEQLLKVIRLVAAGEHVFPTEATLGPDGRRVPNATADLTGREREVMKLLTAGKNTKEAAAIMGVSAKTVETHRLHIMNKLDIQSLAELTKLAIREGLTSLGV